MSALIPRSKSKRDYSLQLHFAVPRIAANSTIPRVLLDIDAYESHPVLQPGEVAIPFANQAAAAIEADESSAVAVAAAAEEHKGAHDELYAIPDEPYPVKESKPVKEKLDTEYPDEDSAVSTLSSEDDTPQLNYTPVPELAVETPGMPSGLPEFSTDTGSSSQQFTQSEIEDLFIVQAPKDQLHVNKRPWYATAIAAASVGVTVAIAGMYANSALQPHVGIKQPGVSGFTLGVSQQSMAEGLEIADVSIVQGKQLYIAMHFLPDTYIPQTVQVLISDTNGDLALATGQFMVGEQLTFDTSVNTGRLDPGEFVIEIIDDRNSIITTGTITVTGP